jgi:hypothetical protein
MNLYTYEFTDLDVGEGLTVNGSADIGWEFENDDPDVGYRGGFEYEITRISIETPHGNTLNLNNADDLYKDVEKALILRDDERIKNQLFKEMEF